MTKVSKNCFQLSEYGVKMNLNFVCVCCWMIPEQLNSESIFLPVTAVGNLVWKGWVKEPTKKKEKKNAFLCIFFRLGWQHIVHWPYVGIVTWLTIALGIKNSQVNFLSFLERKASALYNMCYTVNRQILNIFDCRCCSEQVDEERL